MIVFVIGIVFFVIVIVIVSVVVIVLLRVRVQDKVILNAIAIVVLLGRLGAELCRVIAAGDRFRGFAFRSVGFWGLE